MSTFETKEIVEKVILLGVDVGDDTKESMKELAELVDTAGATVLDSIIQSRERIHPGTYLGKGKIEEVRERIEQLDATGVVCDDELTPAQLRNLEDLLDTKVLDRTIKHYGACRVHKLCKFFHGLFCIVTYIHSKKYNFLNYFFCLKCTHILPILFLPLRMRPHVKRSHPHRIFQYMR